MALVQIDRCTPWSRLTDVPEFNSDLIEKICSQSDAQSDMYSISELEDIRDKNLVELQKALRNANYLYKNDTS